jgi:cell division protein FtsB
MKYPFRNRKAHWAALAGGVCLVAVGAYHVICGDHGLLAYRRAKQHYQLLQQQNATLRQENRVLQEQIDKLNSRDPATIERQAREQLRMAKPGELIFALPESTSKTAASFEQRKGAGP